VTLGVVVLEEGTRAQQRAATEQRHVLVDAGHEPPAVAIAVVRRVPDRGRTAARLAVRARRSGDAAAGRVSFVLAEVVVGEGRVDARDAPLAEVVEPLRR